MYRYRKNSQNFVGGFFWWDGIWLNLLWYVLDHWFRKLAHKQFKAFQCKHFFRKFVVIQLILPVFSVLFLLILDHFTKSFRTQHHKMAWIFMKELDSLCSILDKGPFNNYVDRSYAFLTTYPPLVDSLFTKTYLLT